MNAFYSANPLAMSDHDEPRVALIVPYYGKLPSYFPFYLKGLANQKVIDLLLITDIDVKGQLPENCYVIPMGKEEVVARICDATGINVDLSSNYKLCDLKPSYGMIFQDLIVGYSHWAFGDIDLVYGDVEHFLPAHWESFDLLSFLTPWISASLCILKNSEEMNRLFMKSRSWQRVFRSPEHFAFDECHFLYDELRSGGDIFELDHQESFTWVVKREANEGRLKSWFGEGVIREYIEDDAHITYEPGKIRHSGGSEFAYYHMVSEKIHSRFYVPEWTHIPDQFIVTPSGIHNTQVFRQGWLSQPGLQRFFRAKVHQCHSLAVRAFRKIIRILRQRPLSQLHKAA